MSRRPAKGRVRWFDRVLNYGFIWEDGNSEDIFVHFTTVQVPGTRCLRKNQRVVFEYCATKLGPIAQNVVPIQEKKSAKPSQTSV